MKIELDGLIKAAEKANPAMPGDYYSPETGLLICGKCHTPKQMRISIMDEERVVHVLCRCAQEEYNAEREAAKERERRERIRYLRFLCFDRGDRKEKFTFEADDGTDQKTMQIARGYVADFPNRLREGRGLLFLGPTGTGKTFAACCIANALLDKGYKVRVTTFAEISARLQSTFQKRDVYDELRSYDLLVLDDLGAERNTSTMDEIIFTVIDTRLSARKPIIVTSNINAKDFTSGKADIEDQRVYSRLYEVCLPVVVDGRDRREEIMRKSMVSEMETLLRAGGEKND